MSTGFDAWQRAFAARRSLKSGPCRDGAIADGDAPCVRRRRPRPTACWRTRSGRGAPLRGPTCPIAAASRRGWAPTRWLHSLNGGCSLPLQPDATARQTIIIRHEVKPQIMYIARVDAAPRERRTNWARIGRVAFSKTGRTLYYAGRELSGSQGWYTDIETGELFQIARAREDGLDRSEGRKRGSFPVEIDEDVREEYWIEIRREPSRMHERVIRS